MNTAKRISSYTPSNTDPQILERITVQRKELLNAIVKRLTRCMSSNDKQHFLLSGPRGSGKTHFLTLVNFRLSHHHQLQKHMRIAWLGEDAVISSFIDLALEIADQLALSYPNEFDTDIRMKFRGLNPDDAAEAILNYIVQQLGKKNLLLMMENMDRSFQGLGPSGQQKWRAFLQETMKFATLATSQQLFDGVSKRNEAFFGFFEIHHLQPLSFEDALQLIEKVASEYNKRDLVQFINTGVGRFRVRALRHLAGGNHRMYIMLSEFLTKESLENLVDSFEQLAEELTPYFQERLRSLSPQRARIIQCLCSIEGAICVKSIAEESFIPERNCSKHLSYLRKAGYVRSAKRGKETYYEMAEPIMRLCLEVKNQRGQPLRLIALFLRAWFTNDELSLQSKHLSSCNRGALYCRTALNIGDSLERAVCEEICIEIDAKNFAGDYDNALSLASDLRCVDEISGLYKQAHIHDNKQQYEEEISCLSQVLRHKDLPLPFVVNTLFNRAAVLSKTKDFIAAANDYSTIISSCDADNTAHQQSLIYRASAYGNSEKMAAAFSDINTVLSSRSLPEDIMLEALQNRSSLHMKASQYEQAIHDLTSLINHAGLPGAERVAALLKRAVAYGCIEQHKNEFKDYEYIISSEASSVELKAKAYYNRGNQLRNTGKLQEALNDFDSAWACAQAPIEVRAQSGVNRGVVLGVLQEYESEIRAYSDVICLPDAPEKDLVMALSNRSVAYMRNNNFESALLDINRLLEIENTLISTRNMALFNRAGILKKQGNPEQAITDYTEILQNEKAVGVSYCDTLGNRANDYLSLAFYDEAIEDYTSILNSNIAPLDEKRKALYNRGLAYTAAQKLELAIHDFTTIISDPKADHHRRLEALIERSAVKAKQGELDQAIEDISPVIADKHTDTMHKTRCFNILGYSYTMSGKHDEAIKAYGHILDTPDLSDIEKADALIQRSGVHWRAACFNLAIQDLQAVITNKDIPDKNRQQALFYLPESLIPTGPWADAMGSLKIAFEKTDKAADHYGGSPKDILTMLLQKSSSEWEKCAQDLVTIYTDNGACEVLCDGLVKSIETLSSDTQTSSQLKEWNEAWQAAGKDQDCCKLPLKALDCAVQFITSKDDRILLELPLEIRELLTPLLDRPNEGIDVVHAIKR